MPAPLAKGLIIAASVIVAAGIAIYESPQVRQWVDQSRRKIVVALHSLGDDVQPRRPSESSDDFENRKREIARRRRNELIRKAREEGVAVDLDQLAAIGREEVEMVQRRDRRKTNASQRSFDDLVGSDGMLKKDLDTSDKPAGTTTGTDSSDANLRKRGVAGFMAGSAAAHGNPFSDDHVLFDHDNDTASATRESSVTIQDDSSDDEHIPSATAGQLIDVTAESVYMHPDHAQTASIHQPSKPASEPDQAAESFYSFTSDHTHEIDEPDAFSTGTLTPRSEASAFTGASIVGSQASDIAILASMQNDTDAEEHDIDARSEVFSESGFTEAGFSEAGFSEVGENRGILTPSSWTDVGSDDDSEWGGPAQGGGHVSQIHQ